MWWLALGPEKKVTARGIYFTPPRDYTHDSVGCYSYYDRDDGHVCLFISLHSYYSPAGLGTFRLTRGYALLFCSETYHHVAFFWFRF